MKYAALILVCCFVLVLLMSCKQTTEGENPPPGDTDYSLFGFVRDEDGNIITDANIYVDFGFYRIAVGDTTLPVELSSFTATITPQYDVKLTWVTESETNLYGFNLYRGESTDVGSAYQITPTLINATNTSQATSYSFTDCEVVNHTTYYYWLEVVVKDGTTSFFGPTIVYVDGEEIPELPTQLALGNVYPNPTNADCSIPCEIPAQPSNVSLQIKSLFSGVIKTFLVAPGYHQIHWDGRDSNGAKVCSGVYQAQLTARTPEGTILFDKTIDILMNDSALANEPVVRSSTTGYKISYQKYFQFGTIIHYTGAMGENLGDYEIPQQFSLIVTKPGYQTYERQVSIANLNVSQQEDIVLVASTKKMLR